MSAHQTLPREIIRSSGSAVPSSSIGDKGLPLICKHALPTDSRTYELGKRILDICFALLLLPIAVPHGAHQHRNRFNRGLAAGLHPTTGG
jgi:hypothetical protein